jgi:hypothetical protein
MSKRFVLRLEGGEHVARTILDDIVIDRITLTTPFRAGLNVDDLNDKKKPDHWRSA